MKSIHRGGIGGNVKLRGKLGKMLSCGCCDVWNFKPEYFKHLDELEIRNSKSDSSLLARVEEVRGSEEQG
jgi:hypothetical protein